MKSFPDYSLIYYDLHMSFSILSLFYANVHPREYASLVSNHMALIKISLILKQVFSF